MVKLAVVDAKRDSSSSSSTPIARYLPTQMLPSPSDAISAEDADSPNGKVELQDKYATEVYLARAGWWAVGKAMLQVRGRARRYRGCGLCYY